jgi:hypothetical protein
MGDDARLPRSRPRENDERPRLVLDGAPLSSVQRNRHAARGSRMRASAPLACGFAMRMLSAAQTVPRDLSPP